MNKVIMQNCGKAESYEDFYDWKSVQEAIAYATGFEYAFYDPKTKEIKGFYQVEGTLVKGQRHVYS